MTEGIKRFETERGRRIYQLPLEVFPGFWGYSYVVLADGIQALVDLGSGFGDCKQHLLAGLEGIDEGVTLSSLTHILITHGHIDHFGGLRFVESQTKALIGIHEMDMRVVVQYEARLADVAERLDQYLRAAGVSDQEREALMGMYMLGKELFSSTSVDFGFEAHGMKVGPIELTHVPGHSPGQVVLSVDDILLTSDHILDPISPHIAPESLSLNTGVGHYLESLEHVRPLCEKARLALGGHYQTMVDPARRVDEIVQLTHERLGAVHRFLSEPMTIAQVADELFPGADGYHRLLALEEAGAYVEYLCQRAKVAEMQPEGASLQYHSLEPVETI